MLGETISKSQAQKNPRGTPRESSGGGWLLIRAEAAFSHLLPSDPSALTAVQWGEDAYDAARSDASRFVCTEWLVRKLVRRGDAEEAVRRVDICLSAVTDAQVRQELEGLRAWLIASVSKLPQS